MKLYVNEKLFSFHNRFYVKDESDKDIYEISSKIISLGDKTTINDMEGNKVAYIEQEILHLTPHYNVYISDILEFQIIKKFQLFKNDYTLSNEYRVEGNFFMLDFKVFDDNNNQIGSIKRKFISIGDKYEIEINDISKKEIVLAIIVAITNDVNRSQNTSNNSN
jgi:uncharacterized protein YxjI